VGGTQPTYRTGLKSRISGPFFIVAWLALAADCWSPDRVDDDSRDRQAFYAGVPKPRELKHDAELYRAYTEEAERLRDEGANIHRIVLENDLKREYQEFLQERNRDRDDSDGRPARDQRAR
jgi:hypothetical protein